MDERRYNPAVHLRFSQIAFAGSLLAAPFFTYAQGQSPTDNRTPLVSCTALSTQEKSQTGPEISFANVTFSGFIQMPIRDQEEIAASIKEQRYYGDPLNGVVDEALERVRAGWQDRGYFKVDVSGDAKTQETSATRIHLVLFVHVEENAQYRLGGITFKNNKALYSATLRDVFLIKDGEIFSREKIAKGLEDLRRVYGEYGFLNFTPVPITTFDDEKKLAYLEIDIDEGKQFYVGSILVEGNSPPPEQQVLKELAIRPGDVYNSRLWELSLRRIADLFPKCGCSPDGPIKFDERKGTATLTLDFRSCSLR